MTNNKTGPWTNHILGCVGKLGIKNNRVTSTNLFMMGGKKGERNRTMYPTTFTAPRNGGRKRKGRELPFIQFRDSWHGEKREKKSKKEPRGGTRKVLTVKTIGTEGGTETPSLKKRGVEGWRPKRVRRADI